MGLWIIFSSILYFHLFPRFPSIRIHAFYNLKTCQTLPCCWVLAGMNPPVWISLQDTACSWSGTPWLSAGKVSHHFTCPLNGLSRGLRLLGSTIWPWSLPQSGLRTNEEMRAQYTEPAPTPPGVLPWGSTESWVQCPLGDHRLSPADPRELALESVLPSFIVSPASLFGGAPQLL